MSKRVKDWLAAHRWVTQNTKPLPNGRSSPMQERLFHYYLRELRAARKRKS